MRNKMLALVLVPFLLFSGLPAQAASEKEERTWQDESMYFIMIDRFNDINKQNNANVDTSNLKAYNGGDLEGIMEKLDHIQDMGFTSIMLTPVMDNEDGGYHGYWPNDFYKIEEHFGSMDDMKRLVQEAHKRDMKVILDFVANHTGNEHPWLNDPAKQDWYHEQRDVVNEKDQQQLEHAWVSGLPDLNHENEEVASYLIENATWWIQETDVDGFRLDAVNYVSKPFWSEFVQAVKSVKSDFFLLGEVLSNDPNYIADYEKTGIDGFFNVPYYEEITAAFSTPNVSSGLLYKEWERDNQLYERPYLLGNFIDSHDQKRFTRVALENKQYPPTRFRLALAYLFTSPGIPIMYYGTEVALDGGDEPDNRRLMDFKTDKDYLDYISKLGELRQQLPSLRRGTFEVLYDNEGMSVFKRTYEGETTIIAINNTIKDQKIQLTNEQLAPDMELRGLLVDDLARGDENGYTFVIERERANVYVLADKTGLNFSFIGAFIAVYVLFMLFIWALIRKRKKQQA